MKKVIGVILLVLLHTAGFSQTCNITVKGKITDENSVDMLDGAVVSAGDVQVLTDTKGRFEIKGLCPGKTSLVISHLGCETRQLDFFLRADTLLKIQLNHQSHELENVEIVQHKRESHVTQATEEIQGMALVKLQGLTLGEAVSRLPGVTTINTGSTIAKPVIHGLHSNRVLVMNNGVRLESQQWGSEHAPEIDPYVAKKITLVKGAASLRYGSDAIGGVILVDPAPLPSAPGIDGEVNVAAFSNNAEVNTSATIQGNHANVAPLSWRVQGTFRKGANVRTPNYWLKNTGVEEGNFSVALGWKKEQYGIEVFYSFFKTKIGILSAAHIHNLTDLQKAIESPEPLELGTFTYNIGRPNQDILHQLAKVRGYFQTGKAGMFSATFAFQHNQRTEYDKHKPLGDNDDRPAFQFAIQTMTLDLIWEHRPKRGFSGVVGFNGSTQTNNYDFGYFIPGFWNFGAGAFAIERWNYKRLELEAGVRLDYKWLQAYLPDSKGGNKPVHQWVVPSGSVGMDYHFTENIRWNVNLATAWRAPQVVELYADGVHHGSASFERGNAQLKAEVSYDISTSLQLDYKWVRASLGYYQYFINNFIYLKPTLPAQLTIRGAYPAFTYTQTNASLTGGDIDLTLIPVRGLEISNKTSLLRARNTTAREWLIWMPAQRMENSLRYTFADFKTVKGFYLGAGVLNVFRQNLVPANQDYATPPKGYWLLNFETGASFYIREQPLNIHVAVSNALNTRYRDYLNRFRSFADERGVNVSLRINVPIKFQKTNSKTLNTD